MSEQVTTRVFKGSGYIFARKHSASVSFPKVADMASMTKVEAEAIDAYIRALAVADNELGYLKNGITITETLTPLEDQDDMGRLKVADIQDEKGNAAFALFNANAKTISKIHPLAKAAENTEAGIKLTNLGGIANKDDSAYDILFVHPDTGLTLQFQPNQVTPLNCTYAAQAIDTTGVLYKVSEHMAGKPIYEPGKDQG